MKRRLKGFTLIELLTVIVILGIILIIAAVNVLLLITRARTEMFVRNEGILEGVARNYLIRYPDLLPINVGDEVRITLSELQSKRYITEINNPNNSNEDCEGYVAVEKVGTNDYTYNGFIRCGADYATANGEFDEWSEWTTEVPVGQGLETESATFYNYQTSTTYFSQWSDWADVVGYSDDNKVRLTQEVLNTESQTRTLHRFRDLVESQATVPTVISTNNNVTYTTGSCNVEYSAYLASNPSAYCEGTLATHTGGFDCQGGNVCQGANVCTNVCVGGNVCQGGNVCTNVCVGGNVCQGGNVCTNVCVGGNVCQGGNVCTNVCVGGNVCQGGNVCTNVCVGGNVCTTVCVPGQLCWGDPFNPPYICDWSSCASTTQSCTWNSCASTTQSCTWNSCASTVWNSCASTTQSCTWNSCATQVWNSCASTTQSCTWSSCATQVWNSCASTTQSCTWNSCATQVWNSCASTTQSCTWNSCASTVFDSCATQVWNPNKTLNVGWSRLWNFLTTQTFTAWSNWDTTSPQTAASRTIENKNQTRTRQQIRDWSGNMLLQYVTNEELVTITNRTIQEMQADPTTRVLTVTKYRYKIRRT